MASPNRDPLAAALLPVLLHRVNNATQLLTAVNALLVSEERAGGDPATALGGQSAALASATGDIDDCGWLLALCACAAGADLLGERRERRGLEPLLDALRAALKRHDRALAPAASPLPMLAPAVGRGWELPWLVARVLWSAGTGLPANARLEWGLELDGPDGRAELRAEGPVADAAELRALAERLPGALLELEPDRTRLALPEGWLRPARALAAEGRA